MPSTFTCLHYHVVFATKDRRKTIDVTWRYELHAKMREIAEALEATSLMVGGTGDHVHLVLGLKATHVLADVIRDAKANSSRWVHESVHLPFAWQEGYSAFTVSKSELARVIGYVRNQELHHARASFHEEYLALLKRHGFQSSF